MGFENQRLRWGAWELPNLNKTNNQLFIAMEENYVHIIAILLPVCYLFVYYITLK